MEPIKFDAAVARVQTLADNGIRVTLDLPEGTVMQAAQLMECKRLGVYLKVECRGIDAKESGKAV